MPDPVTLKRIDDTTATLNRRGLVTLEDLRTCISEDVNTGIRWVSTNTGVSAALLMALLIAEAGDDAGKKGNRRLLNYWRSLKAFPAIWSLSAIEIKELWQTKRFGGLWEGRKPFWAVLRQSVVRPMRIWHNRRRHWLDVLAIVLVPLLLIGLTLRLRSIIRDNVNYVAVKQDASQPMFQSLSDDVEIKKASRIDDLSKKMQGGKVLSVPLRAGSYSSTLTTPTEAVMVLSPHIPDSKIPAPQPFDVIVLSIESSGDTKSASLVLPKDKFNDVAPLLASHDVFLVQTAR
jgi:hypothetical protein